MALGDNWGVLSGGGPDIEEHVGIASQNLTEIDSAPTVIVHQPPLTICTFAWQLDCTRIFAIDCFSRAGTALSF